MGWAWGCQDSPNRVCRVQSLGFRVEGLGFGVVSGGGGGGLDLEF